ncbi:MAG: hypothetical protein K0U93_20745 [Gammaproteobacteria bacterium]|nr:hypothetical protein [Gammaproteobacteria bacterium]
MGFSTDDFNLANLPVAAVVTDREDKVIWANDALYALLKTASEQLVGSPLTPMLGDVQDIGTPSRIRGELGASAIARYLTVDDSGHRRLLQCDSGAVPGTDFTLRCVIDLSDMDNRARIGGRFAALALDRPNLDAESGVLNRLAVLQALQTEISRSRRYGNPLGAIWLSVEEATPAEELVALVKKASQALRWVDSMGRLTEDSFLIVLPETNEAGAQSVAGKILEEHGLRVSPTVVADEWHGEDSVDAFLLRLTNATAPVGSAA